ncbi:hypothetical protein FN846DRAFT_892408 [Sphaerosporella brunnea]|uniref:FAD-binding PCMH-type domain-containing protein n=1 Tax=Sphaerosporella brunnea TaxID=1250544 RepID=A0A5J5EQI2_9PEZI|nr:hypothetical protein FN846DRAFT_892408 [Sphaerosporella brunnea]
MKPASVLEVAAQLGLSQSDLAQVSAALSHANRLKSVGNFVLSLLFPHSTLRPGDEKYTAVQQVNWSTRAWLPAALTFLSSSAEEVAKGLNVLTFFSIDFAVRGGGHASFPCASSSDGGVLLSLQRFNSFSLSVDKKVVSFGAGSRWNDVYGFLKPFDLATIGGRIPTVGVSGLITGGGNPFYSGSHGMACAQVKSFEVVLADDSIVIGSADEHPKLFKALKGGSNNFGIVTRFDMYTIHGADGIWGGVMTYSSDKYGAVVDALLNSENNKQPLDPKAALVPLFCWGDDGKQQMYAFHQDTENPESLAAFKELGPSMDTTKKTALKDMVWLRMIRLEGR